MASSYEHSLEHKLRCLVSDGYRTRDIADRLGMNEQVVRRKLLEFSLTPQQGTELMPFGMTQETYSLRAALGQIITDMINQDGFFQTNISEITGLNRNEIAKARNHPYSHDWKLSQIERTLRQGGTTLKDIL